jgi:hypothetical protein
MNGEELRSLSRSERARRIFNFNPVGWQEDLLDSDSPDKSVNAGRQVGKTDTGGLLAAEACLRLRNETVAVLARWQDTADEMFGRMAQHFKNTGLSNEQLGIVDDNAREWTFDNSTRAICRPLPQDADSFRGKLPKVVIVDEGSLVADGVFSRVIEPMFITHGYNHELIVMSTPRGKSGYHYRKHEQDESFESFRAATPRFIPLAVEAGVVDPTAAEWLEDKAEEYADDDPIWLTEFMGQFASVGSSYLPREIVSPNVVDDGLPARDDSAQCWLGVDVAHAGDDRSVYISVDFQGTTRIENAVEQETVPESVERIEQLDEQHGYAGIAVDGTGGLGEAVSDYSADLPHLESIKFTSRSKATMYQRLKRLLEGEELSLQNDDRLIHELTSLTYDFTSSGILQVEHPPGGHDDYSDSLCLALEARANNEDRQDWNGATMPVLGTIREQSGQSLNQLSRRRP